MGVIEFRPDLKDLIRLAAMSANEGKYVLCIHNLTDALKEAEKAEEKSAKKKSAKKKDAEGI